MLVAALACYLPRAETNRPIENQVQVAVYRCTAGLIGGDILNSAAVAIVITIKPKWLDNQSTVFHEVEAGPFEVPAKGVLEWEAEAGATVDDPALCQAETVSVAGKES